MTQPTAAALPASLAHFLDAHAESLDADAAHAADLVPALGDAGLFAIGVPTALGGAGGRTGDAVQAVAAVAERSLSAAFVLWGQRVFVEYLLQSPNAALAQRWLPALLVGRDAGATGLSNAMKFLAGVEALQIEATTLQAPGQGEGRFQLDGRVPWATNVRRGGFVIALAVARRDGAPPVVAAVPSDRAGLTRSNDLDLIALRGTSTASLTLRGLSLDEGDLLSDDAQSWLPRVRPAFLGLQCGMPIGVARASLACARAFGAKARPVLGEPIDAAQAALDAAEAALHAGLDDGRFLAQPQALFRLRITLAEVALQAVQLELQATGGRAYHRDEALGFARRWREAAFLPIVTPSLTQLQGELMRHAALAVPVAGAAA